MAQQQELDPVRIFCVSVLAVLLDDGLTVPKETAKRMLTLAKCLIYKIGFLLFWQTKTKLSCFLTSKNYIESALSVLSETRNKLC